jgi:hypothetical protein
MLNTQSIRRFKPVVNSKKQLLEKYFMSGLEFLAEGVSVLNKFREKLGSRSDIAKDMISSALDNLKMALGDFHLYLENQTQLIKEEPRGTLIVIA